MDGSQIYGSDLTTSYDLRSGVDGLLKTSDAGRRQLFPISHQDARTEARTKLTTSLQFVFKQVNDEIIMQAK